MRSQVVSTPTPGRHAGAHSAAASGACADVGWGPALVACTSWAMAAAVGLVQGCVSSRLLLIRPLQSGPSPRNKH